MVTSASQACREAGTKPSAQVPAGVWHVVGAQCTPAALTRDAGGTAHQTSTRRRGTRLRSGTGASKRMGSTTTWLASREVRCGLEAWSPGRRVQKASLCRLSPISQPVPSSSPVPSARGGSAHNPPRRVAARGTLSEQKVSLPPTRDETRQTLLRWEQALRCSRTAKPRRQARTRTASLSPGPFSGLQSCLLPLARQSGPGRP